MNVANLNISIEAGLLQELDKLVDRRIFPSRSLAIQAALKDKMVKFGKLNGRKLPNISTAANETSVRQWPEF